MKEQGRHDNTKNRFSRLKERAKNLQNELNEQREEKKEALEFLSFCPAIDVIINNKDELNKLQRLLYRTTFCSPHSSMGFISNIRIAIYNSAASLDISRIKAQFHFFRLVNFSNYPLTLKVNRDQKN